MPIRSRGGYLQTKESSKNGSKSREVQPASVFTVTGGALWGGDRALRTDRWMPRCVFKKGETVSVVF